MPTHVIGQCSCQTERGSRCKDETMSVECQGSNLQGIKWSVVSRHAWEGISIGLKHGLCQRSHPLCGACSQEILEDRCIGEPPVKPPRRQKRGHVDECRAGRDVAEAGEQ